MIDKIITQLILMVYYHTNNINKKYNMKKYNTNNTINTNRIKKTKN